MGRGLTDKGCQAGKAHHAPSWPERPPPSCLGDLLLPSPKRTAVSPTCGESGDQGKGLPRDLGEEKCQAVVVVILPRSEESQLELL